MIKTSYDIFYMSRMLKDKLLATSITNVVKEKVERMNKQVSGPLTNLYKLYQDSTHIIDNIYLGNAYNASNYIDLEKNNIGLIVNVTSEIPNYYPDNIEYYNVSLLDINSDHIKDYINDTLEFILKYQSDNPGKNILIHCFMGSSRSAAIVAAYYSYKYNKSIMESIKFLEQKRWIVNLNTTFLEDLNFWKDNLSNIIPNF